jgi:hypothetical protein
MHVDDVPRDHAAESEDRSHAQTSLRAISSTPSTQPSALGTEAMPSCNYRTRSDRMGSNGWAPARAAVLARTESALLRGTKSAKSLAPRSLRSSMA